jgi:serine/threonine-protein kinase
MTTLRHPNIVQLYGHGRRGALPYIVMEYLDGMTLAEVLQHEGGAIPVAETIALIKQVALGLAFLHKNGLVHRDVKPQNVIVGGGGRVTILDLGVVRDQANPGLTRPGAMVGTPYYMSPEQILGAEDIDRRTDVYALAAVTFELLTGRPPFLGENNFEVLYGHKNLPPPDASQVQAAVPKAIGKVLMRALSKRRDERPDTVTELVAELEAAAGPKKVDLARRFAFVTRKAGPAKDTTRDDEKTRLLRARAQPSTRDAPPSVSPPDTTEEPPRRDSDQEVPMADSCDVVSVPGFTVGESQSDLKTVVMHVGEVERHPRHNTAPEPVPDDVPAPRTGQLHIVVTARGKAANAAVSVDGVYEGVTPRTLTLPAGVHRVKLEMAGYKPVERDAAVVAGCSTNLRVVLEKA